MDPALADRLAALNRRFYDEGGEAFSATRRRGWRGWNRLPGALAGASAPLRVLDLGCGNGRLHGFLCEAGLDAQTLGLDASESMLAEARSKESLGRASFERCSLETVEGQDRLRELAREGFALVALFGVMHHLAGRDLRARVLQLAWDCVAPGGLLAVSWWRFDRDPRFHSRQLAWGSPSLEADPATRGIDRDALEPGDTLLRFGEGEGPLRYCHFADDDEIGERIEDLLARGAEVVERFDDDGEGRRLNEYAILRRADAP